MAKYQFNVDLLSFEEPEEDAERRPSAAEKLAAVKAHVATVRAIVDHTQQRELDEQRKIEEMARLERQRREEEEARERAREAQRRADDYVFSNSKLEVT